MNVFKNLFSRASGLETIQEPDFSAQPMPENPLYVIGDIHGRADLLKQLLQQTNIPSILHLDSGPKIVFVGDYVDRGEDSKQVLSMVFELCKSHPYSVTALRGNHEKMLLDFLDNPKDRGARWLRNGGLQTLASFGVGNISENSNPTELEKARDRFQQALPRAMETWLRETPLYAKSGNIWVVHAAADPHMPLEAQSDRTLLWGLSDFHRTTRQDNNWVVHGHTIVEQAGFEGGRVSVDTGAYFTNRLSLAHIENGDITIFST